MVTAKLLEQNLTIVAQHFMFYFVSMDKYPDVQITFNCNSIQGGLPGTISIDYEETLCRKILKFFQYVNIDRG